jgi:quinol monooxygenase YgiN
MINVVASIRVKPDEMEAFQEIFRANVPNVLEEEGCIEYAATTDFTTDIPIQEQDPNVVTVIEKWESFSHLQAHFTAPHMLAYKEQVGDMVESVSLKVLESI